ncbi:MAG: bifunctional adenosylcobinamide kinase/adenosylcobinamide-phosphate guanylyltransferase [Clostridia bacterium]
MGKLYYITGGARSGKSTFAENLAANYGSLVSYIATAIPFDDEMKDRIAKHRQQRPQSWKTYEAYRGIGEIIRKNQASVFILDCITVLITNQMLDEEVDWDHPTLQDIQKTEGNIRNEVKDIICAAKEGTADLIVVTNELGMGLVPEYPLGRVFRDIAGRMNQLLAKAADEAYFLVSGIPLRLK